MKCPAQIRTDTFLKKIGIGSQRNPPFKGLPISRAVCAKLDRHLKICRPNRSIEYILKVPGSGTCEKIPAQMVSDLRKVQLP
ncbi:hypothetical protein EBT16_01270 [bacterium]|nr:hypothetical protein [bacterium]